MDGFVFDSMEDLIEADIQYGLFEDDNKHIGQKNQPKKQKQEINSFWDLFKI